LTYDPKYQTIFWTDGSKKSIQRVLIDSFENVDQNIETVHFLNEDKPRALVSDPCSR